MPHGSVGSKGGRGPVWVPSGRRPPAWGCGAPALPTMVTVLGGCRRAAAELGWAWCAAPPHQPHCTSPIPWPHCTFPCPSRTALVPLGHWSQMQPWDRSQPAGIAGSASAGSSPRWGRALSHTKTPNLGTDLEPPGEEAGGSRERSRPQPVPSRGRGDAVSLPNANTAVINLIASLPAAG